MLSSLTLHVTDLERSVAFYRACGLPLVERRHGGPTHFSCSLNGVHVALYAANGGAVAQDRAALGFTVPDLQRALDAVRAVGARVLEEARPRPWGLSASVEDPDGRTVELLATQTEMTGPVPR